MLELDGLIGFVVFGLWLYCIYDVITTEESVVRNLPKMVWLMLVIFLFDIGALAWLLLGRPQTWQFARPSSGVSTSRPNHDDPDYDPLADPRLEGMGPVVRDREEQARLRMWEAQLQRREEELRRKETGEDGS